MSGKGGEGSTEKDTSQSLEMDDNEEQKTTTTEKKSSLLIVLMSQGVSDRMQSTNQLRAFTLLDAQNIPYKTVDGMDPSQRERRNELFQISGIRGNYPQFFFQQEDGTTTFFGKFDDLDYVNETSNFQSEFGHVVKSFATS